MQRETPFLTAVPLGGLRKTKALGNRLAEKQMPHVIVKLLAGRSEQQKTSLANAIVKDVVAIAICGEESVSVAIEEIEADDWAEKVYRSDILSKLEKLYKRPGYNPFK